MQRQLHLGLEPIDELALASHRALHPASGAVVTFMGFVRDTEAGGPISALEYESFQPMAERQFQLLFDQLETRWPVTSVRLVHRLGSVKVGEPSLWVEITAPHRAEAFAACQWLVDEMKRLVPIWKKPLSAGVPTTNPSA